jgi:hypothetical protein
MSLSLRTRLALAALVAAPIAFYAYRAQAQERAGRVAEEAAARLMPVESPIHASFGGFGGRGASEEEPPKRSVVYLMPPVSAKAAKAWEKLQQPVEFSFPQETPLEDVLKYIKSATQGPKEKGLSIYVDPVGLQDAEKTMNSPVTIDLGEIPIATGLHLALKQLGLTFNVHEDGIVMVVAESDEAPVTDPPARILGELQNLREELSAIRKALEIGKAGAGQDRQLAELREQVEALRKAVTSGEGRTRSEAATKAGR